MVSIKKDQDLDSPSPQSTILVVDASGHLQSLMRRILQNRAFDLLSATTAMDAWNMAHGRDIHLVCMENEIGKVSGFTLGKSLKADPETRTIPLMMITKKNDLSHILKARASGFTDYLLSPFPANELIKRVERLTTIRAVKELAHASTSLTRDEVVTLVNQVKKNLSQKNKKIS